MGYVEKDRDGLTGNSLTLDDLVITWNDEEELELLIDQDTKKTVEDK